MNPAAPPLFESQVSDQASKPLNGYDPAPTQSYSAGEYEIIRLINRDELSRQLFPQFVKRALGFIDRMRVETDKIWLGKLLYTAFADRSPHVLMLVALNKSGEIAAHAIVYPEPYQTLGYVAHILQIELGTVTENGRQKDVPGGEILEVGIGIIKAWVKGLGMKTILNQTGTLAHVRLFEKVGFKLYRYVTRLDVNEDSGKVG